MEVESSVFGNIHIDDDKIIHFVNGLIGFPDLRDFVLITDEDNGVQWLQSIQRSDFLFPVADPFAILEEYNPEVEEGLLTSLGEFDEEDLLVLVIITAPEDLTRVTFNMKAPIVINAKNHMADQVVVEGDAYSLKFPLYDKGVYVQIQEAIKEAVETASLETLNKISLDK